MFIRRTLTALLLAAVLLAGCAKPLPPEKAAYAGEWRSEVMAIDITPGGQVNYKRLNGSQTTTVSGPIKAYEGDNLVVGIGPMKTTFVVSKPPYEEEGKWKMVVDDVVLTRE